MILDQWKYRISQQLFISLFKTQVLFPDQWLEPNASFWKPLANAMLWDCAPTVRINHTTPWHCQVVSLSQENYFQASTCSQLTLAGSWLDASATILIGPWADHLPIAKQSAVYELLLPPFMPQLERLGRTHLKAAFPIPP